MIKFEILPGDCLFVWGNTLIDKGIERTEHGGPSHVAIFLTTTTLEEAQGGRLTGEVDLSFYLAGDARMEVWGDPSLTDVERSELVRYTHELYGKRYDYVLIPLEFLHFECGLPLGWYHNDDSMICSVDVDRIAQHVGKMWSRVPNPAPVDLLEGGVLVKKGVLTKEEPLVS